MFSPCCHPVSSATSRRRGFTLVELLISISVLALIVLLTAQLTNGATNAALLSSKRLEVDNDVRTVFDRMASDLAAMPKREDLDYLFAKLPNANDAFYFYSQAPGFTRAPDNYAGPISLVGYSIRRSTSTGKLMYKMERSGLRLSRAAGNGYLNFLTFPQVSGTTNVDPLLATTIRDAPDDNGNLRRVPTQGLGGSSPSNDWFFNHIVSDSIFRQEFCFLMKALPENLLGPDGKTAKYRDQRDWYLAPGLDKPTRSVSSLAMRAVANDVSAVIVTLAALDSKSRVLLNGENDLSRAVTFFKDQPDGDTPQVAATWRRTLETALQNPSNAPSMLGMPVSAASQIRIYQRYFYIGSK